MPPPVGQTRLLGMKKKSELSPQPVKVKAIVNVKNNNLFIPPPPYTERANFIPNWLSGRNVT
jgi:hypothetical protein